MEPCEDGARPVTGSLFIGPRSLFSIGAKPKESSFCLEAGGEHIYYEFVPLLDQLASRRRFIPFQCTMSN